MPTLPGFVPAEGYDDHKVVSCIYKASTAINPGDALKYTSGANTVEPATSNSNVVGVAVESKASTDSDYASATNATMIPVFENTLFDVNVEDNNGSAVDATTLTRGAEIDLESADGVDMGVSTNDDFVVEKVINATTVRGRFLKRITIT